MIMHIKDVMKKLVEQEKARAKLDMMISHMQDETQRYWHSYISKKVEVNRIFFMILCRKLSGYRPLGVGLWLEIVSEKC
jgi:hypothetical protein